MLWSQRVIKQMTQVKRGAARAVPSRKQQRYSLMKIVGSLALICLFVVFLLQSDPFPGVRQAAMRHRRQTENELDSPGEMRRDFRNPEINSKVETQKDSSKIVTGEIIEEKKKEAERGRIYTLELSNLKGGKKGNVVIQTRPEWAPLGVKHFHELMDKEFYKDAKFFRVVKDFVRCIATFQRRICRRYLIFLFDIVFDMMKMFS